MIKYKCYLSNVSPTSYIRDKRAHPVYLFSYAYTSDCNFKMITEMALKSSSPGFNRCGLQMGEKACIFAKICMFKVLK